MTDKKSRAKARLKHVGVLLNGVVEDFNDASSITVPSTVSIGDFIVQIKESLPPAATHDPCMNPSDARPA
jgi:hypothetical protein